jgi:hypothetical protein
MLHRVVWQTLTGFSKSVTVSTVHHPVDALSDCITLCYFISMAIDAIQLIFLGSLVTECWNWHEICVVHLFKRTNECKNFVGTNAVNRSGQVGRFDYNIKVFRRKRPLEVDSRKTRVPP